MLDRSGLPSAAELLGVPDVPRRGRGRLLAVAADLFYRHGFNAVGLDRVIAEAGVSKTTFYKHFSSKTELMVAALQWRDKWEQQAWEEAVKKLGGDDPRRQLRAYFEVLDWWFNRPDFNGCIFMNAANEFPNPNDPVHKAAVALWHAVHTFVTMLEGTLVMRQVYERNDAARANLPAIDHLLQQFLPASLSLRPVSPRLSHPAAAT